MKELIKKIYGRIFFTIFRIFPLQNKVVFVSYWGLDYGDNPKYISDGLLKKDNKIKQVWLNNSNREFSNVPKEIEVVKWGGLKMIYHLATAKVWVDSHTKPVWVKKRKKQFYIETWHGGLGMKKIESDMGENLPKSTERQIKHNSKLTDVLISNCTFLTNIYKRAFWYNGEILECGYPKNDILFSSKEKLKEIKNKVQKALNIDKDSKIILYAPTFRDNQSVDVYDIDFERLIRAAEKRYNNNFVVLVRLHPRMRDLSENLKYTDKIINATYYESMQELIIASDIFITDYSSGIFDFEIMRKPGFLYCKDLDAYEKQRGLYYDIRTLPFPFAANNDELEKNIINFDEKAYKEAVEINLKDFFGVKEKGTATETIVDLIISKLR